MNRKHIILGVIFGFAIVLLGGLVVSRQAHFAAAVLYWKLFPDFEDKQVDLTLVYREVPFNATVGVRCRTVPSPVGTRSPFREYLSQRVELLMSGYPTSKTAHYSGLNLEAPDGSFMHVAPIAMAPEICSEKVATGHAAAVALGMWFAEVAEQRVEPEQIAVYPLRCGQSNSLDLKCNKMTIRPDAGVFVSRPETNGEDRLRYWEKIIRVIDPSEIAVTSIDTPTATLSLDGEPITTWRTYRLLGDGKHCTIGEETRLDEISTLLRDDVMCAVQSAQGGWIAPAELQEDEWIVLPGTERFARFFSVSMNRERSDWGMDPSFRVFGQTVEYRATD